MKKNVTGTYEMVGHLRTTTITKRNLFLSVIGRIALLLILFFPFWYVQAGAPLQGKHIPALTLSVVITFLFLGGLYFVMSFAAKSSQVIFQKQHGGTKLLLFFAMTILPIPELAYCKKRVNVGQEVYTFIQYCSNDPDECYEGKSKVISLFYSLNWFLDGYPPLTELSKWRSIAAYINQTGVYTTEIDPKTELLSVVTKSGKRYLVGTKASGFCLIRKNDVTIAIDKYPTNWVTQELLGEKVLVYTYDFPDQICPEKYVTVITTAIDEFEEMFENEKK